MSSENLLEKVKKLRELTGVGFKDCKSAIDETNGNIDGANIGEPAPNFNLNYVANGNGNFQLSDHLGKIIVLAFFTNLCNLSERKSVKRNL